jgi:CRISPR-associated protein Cas2
MTAKNMRDYRAFRKYLIKSGFIMMQESVYCKLVQNSTAADAVVENVKKNRPSAGLVQAIRITEKQYAKMEYIVGENKDEILNSDERLVIL